MAKAYVNFYAGIDYGGFGRGAQAFLGRASQPYQSDSADVGVNAGAATKIDLVNGSLYAEIKATTGNIFACIAERTVNAAGLTAGGIRIDQGEKITLSASHMISAASALYIWAA